MGYLRFLLASTVVYGHMVAFNVLWKQNIAVYGFFLISGFLITRVACEIYENNLKGKCFFALNRFVRIYPMYLVCLFLAYIFVSCASSETNSMTVLGIPSTWSQWIQNLTIIGFFSSPITPLQPSIRLLPPSWSLGVEIFYYVIIGLFTATNKHITLLLFGLATFGTVFGYYLQLPYKYFYFTILGASPIFFLGSLTYHYRHLLTFASISNPIAWLSLVILIAYMPDAVNLHQEYTKIGKLHYMHLSVLLLSIVVANLYQIGKIHKTTKIEQFFADISYPVFLLHWPVAAFVLSIFDMPVKFGRDLFYAVFPATIAVSALVTLLVDHPLKRVRSYLRHRALKENVNSTI